VQGCLDAGGATFLQNSSTVAFTADLVVDALATMGDTVDATRIIIVNSTIFASMRKNNLIDFIPDARGEIDIPTFLGHRVIVNDNLRVDAPLANDFDTWIVGGDAVGWGIRTPRVPLGIERNELNQTGGGEEILVSRVEWGIYVRGFDYDGSTNPVGDGGVTNAFLETSANWTLNYARKNIPLIRLVTAA